MEVCDPIKLVGPDTAVKPFTKGLIVDYGVCKLKQRILADCIQQYENKK